jgi:hypothetical protein
MTGLQAPSPLTFPPLSHLTPSMADGEYARARHCLAARPPDEGLLTFVTLTKRFVRSQQNGFLGDKDIHEHLWTAAEMSGLVDHHGADTVQNVMASAIENALADPGDQGRTSGIVATAYAWRAPATIARREWLYGNLLIRKFLSATVAPGGVGKSALVTAETLAQVSGKPLLGVTVTSPLRVWLWNLEDPQEETARRIQAAALHYDLTPADISDRLFVDSGRDQRLVVATSTRNGAVIVRPVIDGLIAEIVARKIDVIVIDPFVSCHEASENDNGAMDMIAKEWARVWVTCCHR